jgi:hypothetical protein
MQILVALVPLAIAGIRNLYLLIAAAVIVILVVILVVATMASRRRAAPRLDIRELEAAEAQGYMDQFQAIENEFVNQPEQAVARARGVVEQVMRRMGFPERVDSQQRVKDLSGHNPEAARSLEAAEVDLKGRADDTELLRGALQSYRHVLHRLLHADTAG